MDGDNKMNKNNIGFSYAAFLTIALLASLPGRVHASNWFYDIDLGFRYDDNVSRAEQGSDIKVDTSYGFYFGAGNYWTVGDGDTVSIVGNVNARSFQHYDGLGSAGIGISASYRHKFGLGNRVPWLKVSGSYQYDEVEDDDRSGQTYIASVKAGKRLSDRWDIFGGLAYDITDANGHTAAAGPGPGPGPVGPTGTSNTDAFDVDGWTLSLGADYTINEKYLLSFGYSYRDGEITSIATPNNTIITAANAIARDQVFGGGRVAYKLDAVTHTFNIDLNRAISDSVSFNLGYTYEDTQGESNIDYDNNIIRANLLLSF
jgi:hypothetical protein